MFTGLHMCLIKQSTIWSHRTNKMQHRRKLMNQIWSHWAHCWDEASVQSGSVLSMCCLCSSSGESLLCSEISQAEPSVALVFLMCKDMKGSASEESDSLLQKNFKGVYPLLDLWRSALVLLVIISSGCPQAVPVWSVSGLSFNVIGCPVIAWRELPLDMSNSILLSTVCFKLACFYYLSFNKHLHSTS